LLSIKVTHKVSSNRQLPFTFQSGTNGSDFTADENQQRP